MHRKPCSESPGTLRSAVRTCSLEAVRSFAAVMLALAGLCGCGDSVRAARPQRVEAAREPIAQDELAMRHPDDLKATRAQPSLGAFELAAVPPARADADAPRGKKREAEAPRELAPIHIAMDPKPRPYPLREQDFVLPSGLIVHRVPKGVSVRAAREQKTGDVVWEFADPRGRRLALLKERSFRRAASASAPVLEETTTLREETSRRDWQTSPVRVIVERFRAEHHIYTLERRARGTGWLWSNLELTNDRKRGRRVD